MKSSIIQLNLIPNKDSVYIKASPSSITLSDITSSFSPYTELFKNNLISKIVEKSYCGEKVLRENIEATIICILFEK